MFNSVKDRDVPQPPVVPGVSAPAAKGRYGGPPPIPVLPADGDAVGAGEDRRAAGTHGRLESVVNGHRARLIHSVARTIAHFLPN